MPMKRSGLISILFLPALASCVMSGSRPETTEYAAADRPNVVIILADDLGSADLSIYGSSFRTPEIDALAREGAVLTSAYATAAVCSPSRAALMTGRYQQRFGFEYQLEGEPQKRFGIDTSQRTLAQDLRDAGYRTALIGKWHLGLAPERHPNRLGFDEFYGFRGGQALFASTDDPDIVSWPTPGENSQYWKTYAASDATVFLEQDQVRPTPRHATDEFTDRAVNFIRSAKNDPFLLVVTYSTPHVPLQATRDHLARVSDIQDPNQRIYRAMVNELDRGVGAIRQALNEAGVTKNTLVIFSSDNGCPDYIDGACSNRPLSGWKRHLLEGGVRVPFIVSWPERIPAGQVRDGLVSLLDVSATARAAAGVTYTDSDGRDLARGLEGSGPVQIHDRLYWKSWPSYAIRDERWKLMGNADAEGGIVRMLFDLRNDPGEKHDLLAVHPEEAARLQSEWDEWNRSLVPGLWPTTKIFDVNINGQALKAVN
jgi:arylsulfatase A-like enzyme